MLLHHRIEHGLAARNDVEGVGAAERTLAHIGVSDVRVSPVADALQAKNVRAVY